MHQLSSYDFFSSATAFFTRAILAAERSALAEITPKVTRDHRQRSKKISSIDLARMTHSSMQTLAQVSKLPRAF